MDLFNFLIFSGCRVFGDVIGCGVDFECLGFRKRFSEDIFKVVLFVVIGFFGGCDTDGFFEEIGNGLGLVLLVVGFFLRICGCNVGYSFVNLFGKYRWRFCCIVDDG